MKTKNLHWNVLNHDFNRNEIVEYDIFSHAGFVEDLKKADRSNRKLTRQTNDENFLKEVDRILHYYFWAKAEHEILVKGLFDNDNKSQVKIDAYTQIKLNWDAFAQYLLECRYA